MESVKGEKAFLDKLLAISPECVLILRKDQNTLINNIEMIRTTGITKLRSVTDSGLRSPI